MSKSTTSRGLSLINSIKCSTCENEIPLESLSTHECEALSPTPAVPSQYKNYNHNHNHNQNYNQNYNQNHKLNYNTESGPSKPLPFAPTTSSLTNRWRNISPSHTDSNVESASYLQSEIPSGSYFTANSSSSSSSSSFSSASFTSTATSTTNLTSPDSSFGSGKAFQSSNPSINVQPAEENMAPSKVPKRPALLQRLESSTLAMGPFGPKSPSLFSPTTNPWGSSSASACSSKQVTPQTSPEKSESVPKLQDSPLKKPSPGELVGGFLKDATSPPSFSLKSGSASPNLSNGPGPAFEDDKPVPVSPFDFGFRSQTDFQENLESLSNNNAASVHSTNTSIDEVRLPLHRTKGSTNPRFNQFPPPKNRKGSPTGASDSRPGTSHSSTSTNTFSMLSKHSTMSSTRSTKDMIGQSHQSIAMSSPFNTFIQRANTEPVQATAASSKFSGPIINPSTHTSTHSDPISKKDVPAPRKRNSPRHVCRACKEIIIGSSLKDSSGQLTGRYHKKCFSCFDCSVPLATASFHILNDEPLCPQHYHEKAGSLCKACGTGIEGEYAETSSSSSTRKHLFHRQCFCCQQCGDLFPGTEYWEKNGLRVCHKHVDMNGRVEKRSTRFGMMGSNNHPTIGAKERGPPPAPSVLYHENFDNKGYGNRNLDPGRNIPRQDRSNALNPRDQINSREHRDQEDPIDPRDHRDQRDPRDHRGQRDHRDQRNRWL